MRTKKIVIIKVGTNVITDATGRLNTKVIKNILRQVAELKHHRGFDIVLVTSGAMAAGRSQVKLITKPDKITERQVFAATGQVTLMGTYEKLLAKHKLHAAQVLTTRDAFRDREHYLNMQRCFAALLENNVLPIVNENDVISIQELMFTDNDELAGLVAAMLNAQHLFLLTNVDGLLDAEGKAIPLVHGQMYFKQYIKTENSSFGRGGMQSKCAVAERAAGLGITTFIINGLKNDTILQALNGDVLGTKFLSSKELPAIKKWLAQSRGLERGAVVITAAAERALHNSERAVSLLPIGITNFDGEFKKGDVIQIKNSGGKIIGYGRAEYGSEALAHRLGKKNEPECIHCDYLYLQV